jgi:hypothetical protein
MPRRARPTDATRSEKWLRVAVNDRTAEFSSRVAATFGWHGDDPIEWLSPLAHDGNAEYFDQAFLDRLGVESLRVPLTRFWPASGPRWDGLGRTRSGKLILVEAKAYVEEAVDYRTDAKGASLTRIRKSLAIAKRAFKASAKSNWETPFYQYANRLAHLYFLNRLNRLDAYLVFVYFADAEDVPNPCSEAQWSGAVRVIKKALGLSKNHPFSGRVGTLIWTLPRRG